MSWRTQPRGLRGVRLGINRWLHANYIPIRGLLTHVNRSGMHVRPPTATDLLHGHKFYPVIISNKKPIKPTIIIGL